MFGFRAHLFWSTFASVVKAYHSTGEFCGQVPFETRLDAKDLSDMCVDSFLSYRLTTRGGGGEKKSQHHASCPQI